MTYTPADETKTAMFNVDVQKAYGSGGPDGYFCDTNNPGLEKSIYKSNIESINFGVESIEKYGGEVTGNDLIGVIVSANLDSKAKCLKEKFNINPGDVAELSEVIKERLANYIEGLYEVAPHFAEYTYLSNTEASASSVKPKTSEGGCLIATAAYGTELAAQIQTLREIRDSTLMRTESGSAFMSAFNSVYYAFSPVVADWERQNSLFAEAVRTAITPMIWSLLIMSNIDGTEESVLAYGILVLALNVGMYLIMPILATLTVVKFITKRRTIQTLT